jgi:hypothetical protein
MSEPFAGVGPTVWHSIPDPKFFSRELTDNRFFRGWLSRVVSKNIRNDFVVWHFVLSFGETSFLFNAIVVTASVLIFLYTTPRSRPLKAIEKYAPGSTKSLTLPDGRIMRPAWLNSSHLATLPRVIIRNGRVVQTSSGCRSL